MQRPQVENMEEGWEGEEQTCLQVFSVCQGRVSGQRAVLDWRLFDTRLC